MTTLTIDWSSFIMGFVAGACALLVISTVFANISGEDGMP